MSKRLTDGIVKSLPTPERSNKIFYDADVKGFGVRVTKSGARAFILNYRTRSGRERRFTIGNFPDWKTGAAREEAGELKKRIDVGADPLAEVEADRDAKTVDDLCDRFEQDHLPRLRAGTAREYRAQIRDYIRPTLKHFKVAEVSFADIDGLHRKMTKRTPIRANRMLQVASKMFSLAVRWKWRTDNPVKGVERNQEQKRDRYLTGDELARLIGALGAFEDRQAANIVRFLLLTGARRGEVLGATWDQFDLEAGVWTKPGSTTKQKTLHRVPLSGPARQLLAEIRADAEVTAQKKRKAVSEFVFPGQGETGHRSSIRDAWADLCIAAEIVERETVKGIGGKDHVILRPSIRIHDLRHSYASYLVNAGLSLPVIGALLGHSNPSTTSRYAHLFDDPLRAATERVGAIVSGKPSAEVVPIKDAG